MQRSCGAVPSPSEELHVVISSSTAVVGMAIGESTAEGFVTSSAASDKSAAPTDSKVAAQRRATDNTIAVATGSTGLTALGAAQHPALANAPEETLAELATLTVLRQQSGREAVEAGRVMRSTTADLRSVVSYWPEDSASLSTPGDTEVEDATGVYCKSRCIHRQLPPGSYLPGPSRPYQATTAAAGGSGGSHLCSAADLQQGPPYSGACDTDGSFYSRSSRWSSVEEIGCSRGSNSTSLLREKFARPLHQIRVLDEDGSHARTGAGSNDCDRTYTGKREAACPPANSCSGPCTCSKGGVHARYSHSREKRRLLSPFICGNEAAVDEVSTIPHAVAEADLKGVEHYTVDTRDDNRKSSLLGGREPLLRQATQQPARQEQPVSIEKDRLVGGRSGGSLQAYECLHQQLLMEQRLHQQGEQQGSWHLRSCERPRAAVALPRLEASCSGRLRENHVADSVRQQAGISSCAEEQPGGEEAGLLRAANCYSRRGGARTYMPAHSSCVAELPQPSDAEGAAQCYPGGPHGEQPLLSGTVVRSKHVMRATSVSTALHRTQRVGDGAVSCADVSCGSSRRLQKASFRNPAAAAATHGELASPHAAPASAAAVCPSGEQSYSAETSACPYGGVWEQKKPSTDEDASTTNGGAYADVHSRPLKEESHLVTIVPDSGVAVAPTASVVEDFRERPGVAPASVSSFAVPVDSLLGTWEKEQRHLYPQQIPHQLMHHHQYPQGMFYRKVHQHLQIQRQQLQQQFQPEGRCPHVRSEFMQQDRETTHHRKQAPASDSVVSAVSLGGARGAAGEEGRQWLAGALRGDTSIATHSGTGTLDAAEVRGRQEVAPLSFACPIEESSSFSSLSGCSTPVNGYLSEEETQHAGEGVGTVSSRQQTEHCSQYQALQRESFTQHQMGSSRHHHQRGLLQPQRRQELVCQQQELQQQHSSVPHTYVEGGLSVSDSKTESVPVEASTQCNSGTPSVEAGEHESWTSVVESACYTVGSGYTSESSACYSYVRTTEAAQKPAGPEERAPCTGRANTAYTGHCKRATCGGGKWSSPLCPPTQVRSTAPGAAAELSSRAAGGTTSYTEAGRLRAISCSCSLVQPRVGSAGMTLCLPSGVLPFPVQLLHTVGVVGAAAPAVTEVNDAEEGSAGGGRKEVAPGEQRVSPRRVGRSHSVLKRAASADPASGRFAKVKTVSFADLNECESSVVGRSTSSLQDIDPTAAPSTSPPLCPSNSGRDAVVAKEIGKSSGGAVVERPGGEEAAAAGRAGGGPEELVGADAGIEMQKVRSGARQAALADAARKGRRRQEDGREEAGKAESSLGRRLRSNLVGALAVLTRRGPGDDAVAAASDRDGGGRATVNARAEVASRGLQARSSNSLSSQRVPTRRGDGITPGGRDRQEIQSGSSSNNGGGEEIGGSGNEGEGREAGWRRRRRVCNKRRRRRVGGGNGSRTDRSRGTRSPAARAGRGQRRSRSAESTPSSDSIVAKASSRLTRVLASIFRAFQNLTEHDTVFGMREELLRRDSAPLSRGGATESEIAAAVSPLAGAAGGGSSSSVGGGGGTTAGGVHQGLPGAESPGGGGGEGSVSRSVSSDVLLRRLPLKFVDRDLEDLFAGNINQWMTTRLLLMGVLMLVVTSLMWPLMAWSFNLQDAFDHSEPIGVLFHVDMSLNVIISLLFIVTRFSDVLTDHAELIGDAGTFVVITIWGIWNTVASFVLERSYVRDVIQPQMVAGQQSYVSLDKTTSWSCAQEASSAVAYLYGLLLIVQLDVVYPSRTRRTWQIHLMFFLLSSSSIIVRGAINPNFVPVPFVVIRVATYLMLTIFLYIGRHATELQQRHTFYNWLMTRKRMDRLESDLKRQKESGKVSTAVEQLVDLIKQCKDIFHSLETGVADISPFHRMQLDECNRTLDRCLSILTNTTNLYTVQFGELDSDTHREIIQAFLNTHNSSPADWTRVAREAFTRTSESRPYTSTPSRYAFRPPLGISDIIGRDVIVDVHPPAEAPNGTAEQRRSTNSHDTSDAGYSPLSSKGSAFELQTDNALPSSPSTAGVGAAVTGATGAPVAVPRPTSAAAAASTSGTKTEGSKALAQDPHGDTVFKFVYSSPRGVDFSDGEVLLLQVPRKKTRVSEDCGPQTPDGYEGASEYDESRLRTTVAADELETGAPESKHGTSRCYSAGTTAVAVRDTARRSKWTSSGWTGHVRDDAAAQDAARTVTSGYGSPVSGSRLEDTFKQREGKSFPESQTASVSERSGGATGMAAGEPEPTFAAGSLAGKIAGRIPGEERERQAAMAQRDEEAAAANRVQGRRLSSAVAPEESDDGSGVASSARTAQQKRLLTPEGVVPRAAADLSRSSATASTTSRKKSSVAGELVYRAFVMDQRACKEMKARNEAVAKILILPPGSPELNLVQRLSEEEVQSWDFDCLRYAKESPAPLVEVGYALLAQPCENLMLPRKETLVRFLKAVEAQYNAVPYHNSIHGFMVSQKMVALTHLLKLTSKINSRDLAVLVVAGLCHDIGHPGRNNALLINAIDPVAVLYNDKSVLENYHACLTFKTLDLPDCDLFSALRSKIRREYHVVRSLIIELILATDMKNHFETVSRFRIRRLAADFDTSGEEDLWFLLKIVIKCADLSHCGVSWSEHFEWCLRLCTEFYDQGDEELARHLPVSPLCEREKHAEIAKSQLGFMNFVTIPLYEELVAVDSTGDVERCCISYMKTNVKNWELTASAGVPVPLYGKDVSPEVQPPFSQLLDQSQHPKPKAGSKAAEIASRYARVTFTCLDLTPLVTRTQLSRSERDSQRSTDRSRDAQTKRAAT